MQLITELAATVSCLVCSKSSGTPLGKMRGLITVKLANEQVNYRTKFLQKNCHFFERCSSSCSKCLKTKGGGLEEEKTLRTNGFLSSFFFLKKTLVSAPLSAEAHRLRLRGNGCINELLFFSEETFYPCIFSPPLAPSLSVSLPLTQETASTPPPPPAFYPVTGFHLYTSLEPLGGLRFFFICNNHVGKEFLSRLKFARTFHFAHKKELRVNSLEKRQRNYRGKKWLTFLADLDQSGSVSSGHKPAISVKELHDAPH